ncbi:LD-carboxypeptidase [Brevibacterium permense]|uniref:S66 peptidase family protein n=1 Tax=Brevibacterium permense TaxID=234834 RepID=UPI0021CF7EE6|nr:LD-carboxypeptidase [Brevibacterium permense]MCU4296492.1 LD-carboxypeptidase [Brevibacterium permense]
MSKPSPYLDSAPLAPGDTVRLIAPSGPTDEDSLQRAIAQLETWGLRVVTGEHIRARHPRVKYLAGTDAERRSDLVDAWCDPDTDAVIALRGGFGAMRLLDGIDFDLMRRHMLRRDGRPKLLTGSSDITALHQAWDHQLGVATLFCPMVGNDPFKNSTVVPDEVASWLVHPWGGRELGFPAEDAAGAAAEAAAGAAADAAAGAAADASADENRSPSDTFGAEKYPKATSSLSEAVEPSLKRSKWSQETVGDVTISTTQDRAAEQTAATRPLSRAQTLVPGSAKGRLGGGNLSLIAAGMGSPELIDVRERRDRRGPSILMLEDVDEELYRLDNLMVQLIRGGWFTSADAVVLGSWEDCAPVHEVEALMIDYLGGLGIPIVSEMGFGHDPDAPSAPLGVDVTLEAKPGERPRLWVDRADGQA